MNHHTIFKPLLITLVVFGFTSQSNAQTTGTNQQKSDSIIQQNKHSDNYEVVEQMPEFPGGERALMDFIGSNLKYPLEAQKSGIQGTVLIRFVISKTGKVTKVEVLRSVFSALDDEAVRVVKLLPDWIPGEQKGQKVNVYFTLPIRFKLT